MRRTLMAVLLALASAGCLRSTTTIELKPDGSGTVVQETGMTAEAMGMLKGLASAKESKEVPGELFGEDQARKAAATMGVTFVSGEPFKANGMEGYRARYSFDDIAKIKVNMDQGGGMASDTRKPPFGFVFNRGATTSLLTIQMPDQPTSGAFPGMPATGGSDVDKAQAAQALAMMKMMMRGLFVDVTLNVNGRIVKSNSPYVDGSRVTLLQIDFDKLMADEASLLKLQSAKDLKTLSSVPGLKISSEPKVTVEFSR